MGQLVLLGLRAEAQFVDVVDDLAQIVAALDLVFDFAEDFADFVLDSVRAAGLLLEAVKIGKELATDEVAEVITGLGFVVVHGWIFRSANREIGVPGGLGRGPFLPAVGLVEEKGVLFAVEGGFIGFVLLQCVEVFQEEEPGGLLGVVQLGGAAGLLAEDIVNVLEGLFKHGRRDYS